ncbi:uncharacterized protein SAPINGB_P002093 [Magnusiomyces paraingens]|uniref:Cytochrome c oxidase subunit 6B-like protein new16 n=1 Tax=Magnusiomyces paraingens TaxID=2606893 RepID=A0A5E8BDF8_9ASCO|nr:uncharacterized protein SAPINGB_P002093 [Saprochaete ingens]VVT49079.1 unnamed protein product [Saprochaete ingens]
MTTEHPNQDSVLKKSGRKLCWDARDKYFACLDKANIIDVRKPENAAKSQQLCGSEEADFNKDCIASWVDYFRTKRANDWERDQQLKKLQAQGAIPLDSTIRFK